MTEKTKRRSIILAGMTVMVSFITFGIIMVLYVTHALDERDQELCGVIAISLRPRPQPPTNPNATTSASPEYIRELERYTKQQAAITQQGIREMRALSAKKQCPKVSSP